MASAKNIERSFQMNISRDIIETVTVVGIYDLRRLQIKRCGRLGQRDVLALDCCPNITRNVQVTYFLSRGPKMFIPLQQCMETNRSKFEYQVYISQIAPDYLLESYKLAEGRTG